jgi:site-specific recombinase XerD
MFEDIFFPRTAAQQRAAPLAEQRAGYLRYLKEIGTRRATLRKCANDHLNLVCHLGIQDSDRFSIQGIEAAATIWSKPNGRRCKEAATAKARQRFVSHGVGLLHYLGWFEGPEDSRHPHGVKLLIFENWLRGECGLSGATIDTYCRAADHFLVWLAARGAPMSTIEMVDIDEIIAGEHSRGAWSRRTIHDFAQRLRSFIGFAEKQGWCRPGLAAGIMAPRYMADETVPKGIKREDVERLLVSVQGERPVDKRDRAILMLLVAYGLRASEVAGLQIDNLDWENGILRVRCPKPGRTHLWPLSPAVGNAILDYMRDARPTGFGPSLFFTSYAPIRPLGRKAFCKIVHDRLARIGVVHGRRGPHALRHAAAQHLLDQGMSMKVIGDFLGHRNPSSTAIYAKVNLAALREVATLDLEGLA